MLPHDSFNVYSHCLDRWIYHSQQGSFFRLGVGLECIGLSPYASQLDASSDPSPSSILLSLFYHNLRCCTERVSRHAHP